MKYESLPLSRLQDWAELNNVEFRKSTVSGQIVTEDGLEKGGGLIATSDHEEGDTLLRVPENLILNRVRIDEYAKSDHHLREVLHAVGVFAQVGYKKVSMALFVH